jgi:hypothetical protein
MGKIARLFGLEPKNYGEYYTYALLDPRFNPPRTIYFGKGMKDRVHDHERETRRLLKRGRPGDLMGMSCKEKRILEILNSGVLGGNCHTGCAGGSRAGCRTDCIPYEIVEKFDEEGAAYRAERRYIEDIGIENLCNETYGMGDEAIDRLIKRRLAR